MGIFLNQVQKHWWWASTKLKKLEPEVDDGVAAISLEEQSQDDDKLGSQRVRS